MWKLQVLHQIEMNILYFLPALSQKFLPGHGSSKTNRSQYKLNNALKKRLWLELNVINWPIMIRLNLYLLSVQLYIAAQLQILILYHVPGSILFWLMMMTKVQNNNMNAFQITFHFTGCAPQFQYRNCVFRKMCTEHENLGKKLHDYT